MRAMQVDIYAVNITQNWFGQNGNIIFFTFYFHSDLYTSDFNKFLSELYGLNFFFYLS